MKRHNSLIPLSMDHHHGLIAAQFCMKNSPGYKKMPADPEGKCKFILAYGKNDLFDHFRIEEEVLIPAINGKNDVLDELTGRVLREHRLIKQLIQELEDANDVELALENFGKAVDHHIRFEEREWFQKIQKTISDITLLEIGLSISHNRPQEKQTNF